MRSCQRRSPRGLAHGTPLRKHEGVSETSTPRFPVGRWQREVAPQWAEWRESPDSIKIAGLERLVEATLDLLGMYLRHYHVNDVLKALPRTLTSCDQLDFEDPAEVIAYSVLHLTDRYSRIQQALDEVFSSGNLPIRKRELTVLEVGAGPAPAGYSIRDYYEDLRAWVAASAQPVAVAGLQRLSTIDRGPAWQQLVHWLSEFLTQRGLRPDEAPVPFEVTYADLTGFSVRRIHHESAAATARWIQDDAESWDEYVSPAEARREAYQSSGKVPSAYDLIVLCNFLTNSAMTEKFASEIAELARSLTPGGMLLVLGAAGGPYPAVYSQLEGVIAGVRPRVQKVVDVTLRAQSDPVARGLIAGQIRAATAALRDMAPDEFSAVATSLGDAAPMDEQMRFPMFRIFGWKNEGRHLT